MSAKRHSPWAACYSAFDRTWMLRAIVEKKYRHHFIDVRAHYLGKTAKKTTLRLRKRGSVHFTV